MKKQAEISRNPMIYNNLEFEKPVKAVDFCRSRVAGLTLLKLGSLLVWVAVLALALKLALLTIVALTAMLGYSYFKRPRL